MDELKGCGVLAVIIIATLFGITSFFDGGTFLGGFMSTIIFIVVIIVIIYYQKEQEEAKKWQDEIEHHAMTCHKCGKMVVPIYMGNGHWKYICGKCSRSWRMHWDT